RCARPIPTSSPTRRSSDLVMGMLQRLSGAPVWWAGMSTSARRVRDLYTDLGRTVDDPELSLDVLTTRRDERGDTGTGRRGAAGRSEEHTSELQSRFGPRMP